MLENALFVYAFGYMFELTGTGWCIIATWLVWADYLFSYFFLWCLLPFPNSDFCVSSLFTFVVLVIASSYSYNTLLQSYSVYGLHWSCLARSASIQDVTASDIAMHG